MPADDVLTLKAADLRRRIERVRAGAAAGMDVWAADERTMESVAFNVLLAVQDAVDLCAHVIASQGWDPPESLAAGFTELERRGVLTAGTADAMRRGTRLRNLIAHGYARIDPVRLRESAAAGVAELEQFLAELARWEART